MGLFGGKKKDTSVDVGFTTSQPMSLEELYDAIKDVEFEAGEPKMFKSVIGFTPYVTEDVKITIEGKDGEFRCKRTDGPLDGGDLAGEVVGVVIERLLFNKNYQHRTDGRLSEEMQAKYGDLHTAVSTLVKDAVDKINAMNL